MNKVEDLLKVEVGMFATPKKLNRSDKAVKSEIITDLEAGKFTHEMIAALVGQYPIFRYRTCITVHGTWPEIERQRIGSYKNVIQNANGSVEIRYSAIDRAKKQHIASLLPAMFTYYETSAGGYFQAAKRIDADNFQAVLAELRAAAERIQPVDFYGSVSVYRAADFCSQYLVLNVTALAIPEQSVTALLEAMAGQPIADLQAAKDAKDKEREAERAQWDKEAAERRVIAAEQTKLSNEHGLTLLQAIEHLPTCNDLNKGILVKVVRSSADNTKCVYKYYRLDGKGAFGRVKYSTASSTQTSVDGLTWKEQKEVKLHEIKITDTRLFTLSEKQPEPTKEPAVNSAITYIDYSERAFALVGDTKQVKDTLKNLGGSFNPRLSCGCGWIFPKTKESAVRQALQLA